MQVDQGVTLFDGVGGAVDWPCTPPKGRRDQPGPAPATAWSCPLGKKKGPYLYRLTGQGDLIQPDRMFAWSGPRVVSTWFSGLELTLGHEGNGGHKGWKNPDL